MGEILKEPNKYIKRMRIYFWSFDKMRKQVFYEYREFAGCLKQVNVSLIFRKDNTLDKKNYRPVSVVPLLSKVYKKLFYNQLSDHVENIFSVTLQGFRKLHSTQLALFKLLQSWQKELDEKGMVATVLMDLSKAYDSVPHDLLPAKLNAYGIESVELLWSFDFISRHKRKAKIG